MREFEVYEDKDYKLTLRANGIYILSEFEDGRWYSSATGPYKYMLMVLEEQGLSKIIAAIT